MKLYYSPAACSMSPNIVAHEAGLPLEIIRVDLRAKLTETGADYKQICDKGYVPALQLQDGSVLTEGVAIVQYLADLAPQSGLIPAAGTMDRYRMLEMLNYIATEMHKGIGGLFNPKMPDDYKAIVRDMAGQRLTYIASKLADKPYLFGHQFTVADAYLFTVLGWTKLVGIDLAPWPSLTAYVARIAERPAVKVAMQSEGLFNQAA